MTTTTLRKTARKARPAKHPEIPRVEYEDAGKRYTNSAEAWRKFVSVAEEDRRPPEPDEYDDYEAVEVFIPRDTLRRAEAIAEERGTNVGDLIADTLAIGVVAGRGGA